MSTSNLSNASNNASLTQDELKAQVGQAALR